VSLNAADLTLLGAFQISALAFFLFAFGARTVQLRLRQHINPITLSLGKRGILGIVELSLFVVVNLWVLAVLAHALPGLNGLLPAWSQLRLIRSLVAQRAGVVLTLLAFVICLAALRALGNSWRLGIDEKQPGKLVTTGIYRFSRNPIFVFFDLYFVSAFLLNGTVIFLLFALFTILNLHCQILQEERFLAQAHGSDYQRYCRRTCRYATWHWVLGQLFRPPSEKAEQRTAVKAKDTTLR